MQQKKQGSEVVLRLVVLEPLPVTVARPSLGGTGLLAVPPIESRWVGGKKGSAQQLVLPCSRKGKQNKSF